MQKPEERIGTSTETAELLQLLKIDFSRPVPAEYIDLAKTAAIAPTAPTYGWSVADIIKNPTHENETLQRLDSGSAYVEISDSELTKLGHFLKEKLRDDTLLDLGCGQQVFVRNLARALGAQRYIGVDIEATDTAIRTEQFEQYTLNGDMLLTVTKMRDNYGSFFIAGAEDYSGEGVQREYVVNEKTGETDLEADIFPSAYMEKLLEEIYRVTRFGGLLILGANNTIPDPTTVGFRLVHFDNQRDLSTAVYIKE